MPPAMPARPACVPGRRAGPRGHRGWPPPRLPRGPADGQSLSLLELRDIEVEYRRAGQAPLRAVAGASLSVDAGQVVGLVGETGCGESTLARAAVGLQATTPGTVLLEGT